MKLAKFKYILESMKAREKWEQDAYNLGIDLFNIPNDPYEWVIELLNEINITGHKNPDFYGIVNVGK